MATIEQLERALRNADAAGDEQAARRFALEIRRMQGVPTTRGQSQELSADRVQRQAAAEEESSGFLRRVDAAVRGVADGLTLGFADEISAGLGAATGIGGNFLDYYGNLEAQRAQDESDANNVGGTRLAGQVAGSVALPLGAARNGVTLMRSGAGLGSNIVRGALEGASYGAAAGLGTGTEGSRLPSAFAGFGFGALAGGAAPAVVAGGSRAIQPVYDAVRQSFGPVATQAANRVVGGLRNAGLTPDAINGRLSQLGPESALVDVMGARGQALARSASNLSPDARATLEGFSGPRQALQPERVVSALETAAGLPQGSRLSVDGLRAASDARAAPAINQAYAEARAAGFDLPLEDFQEIIGSPMGAKAFREASKSIQNRMAAGNDAAASNLGLLDAMKRRIDAAGEVARRAGDNDTATQASGLSRALRDQIDGMLDGSEYARARALRQEQYRVSEAFDTGAELAGSRIQIDAPSRLRAQGAVRPEVAQGYAAELAESILNRRGTPDALNRLNAPLQREAMDAALGSNAEGVRQQLARERVFGETHRALTGNSTTARQLAEMGMTAGAGAGLGFLGGLDPTQAGMAGIATVLARRAGGAAVSRLRSNNEEAVAQEIARLLVGRGVPVTPNSVSTALGSLEGTQTIARLLVGASGQASAR